MNRGEFLDAAKRGFGVSSDYALAKRLQVTPQAVSEWRSGKHAPSLLHVYTMAEAASIPPAVAVAELERERAELAARGDQVAAWKRVLQQLAGTVAGVLLGAVLIGPGPAKASIGAGSGPVVHAEHTTSRIRRRARRATWCDCLAGTPTLNRA